MFQRAPISSSSDPQRASVKIVPPSRRTFSISTVPQRREKTAGARREPIFFTLAVHTLHPLFSTTRGFADKSRHLFVSPKNKQQSASAPGLSDKGASRSPSRSSRNPAR